MSLSPRPPLQQAVHCMPLGASDSYYTCYCTCVSLESYHNLVGGET